MASACRARAAASDSPRPVSHATDSTRSSTTSAARGDPARMPARCRRTRRMSSSSVAAASESSYAATAAAGSPSCSAAKPTIRLAVATPSAKSQSPRQPHGLLGRRPGVLQPAQRAEALRPLPAKVGQCVRIRTAVDVLLGALECGQCFLAAAHVQLRRGHRGQCAGPALGIGVREQIRRRLLHHGQARLVPPGRAHHPADPAPRRCRRTSSPASANRSTADRHAVSASASSSSYAASTPCPSARRPRCRA